jgi:hypothetical protein
MEADQLGRLRDILQASRLIASYMKDTLEAQFRADTQKGIEPGIRNFILERETSLVWHVVTLMVAVLGATAAVQFGLIYFILTHVKP